ncbi:MAG: cysteine synthase family protein [Candidatus Marinimicrobia bacterium]|nr:cysteine synthase family protein [Candidatus Neomarinimicrobiota bacterium]
MGLFELVGKTPMVSILIFSGEYPAAKVWAKAEYLNPGGSLKDRPVARMLLNAFKQGRLDGGKVILDSTSGNAGIAYAIYGQALGHQVELVIPGNASKERLMRIKAHGANVILTDPLEGYDEALREVQRLYKESPEKYYFADQYGNKDNWLAHYETTGEEIITQAPDLTHFVGGIGTGGSVTGISRKLKEHNRDVTVVVVRPERFPGIEGLKPLGEEGDVIPAILDETFIDEYLEISSEAARIMCHRLAQAGFFVGQSSGAYMVAVEQILRRDANANIVTLLNDTGERYISTSLWLD